MPSFKERSYQKELLDGNDIPFADIKKNMQELEFINKNLGGHRITLKGVRTLLSDARHSGHIVEIGCGGGDNLHAIKNWALRNGIDLELSGIDINEACIRYARGRRENQGIRFLSSDYRDVSFPDKPAVLFSSLFCHHFTDEELVVMLQWMKENTTTGFFINDLHRHPLAYYSIKWLTRVFSGSYLVKHDAPLSVRRGFTRNDWQRIFSEAGITDYTCTWQWAFRWLITFRHETN